MVGVGQLLRWVKQKPAPRSSVFTFMELYMKKQSDKNSKTSAVAGFAGAIDDAIPQSAGVELCSEIEHLILSQFTRARAKEDWRDMNLFYWLKL